MEDGRVWDNVVYCDRVGRIVSTAGTLVFLPVGNTDSKPLISITLLDFSFARYLVKSEGAGQVRLVVKPESRTPQTIDFAFSRLSHMAEFNNFRNYCIHNRKQLKARKGPVREESALVEMETIRKPLLPYVPSFHHIVHVILNVSAT